MTSGNSGAGSRATGPRDDTELSDVTNSGGGTSNGSFGNAPSVAPSDATDGGRSNDTRMNDTATRGGTTDTVGSDSMSDDDTNTTGGLP